MKGILVVAFCAVYSVQAWTESLGPLHIETATGNLPPRYFPLSADDKHATRKAGSFVSFLKIMPLLNPLQLPSMGPYSISLPDVDFQGDLKLNNVVINGIKALTLSDLEVRMKPGRLDFNASLPQINADIGFELKAVLSKQPLNVYGKVSAGLSVGVQAAVGTKVAQFGPDQVYQVDAADVILDVGQLQVNMDMSQFSEDFRSIAVQFLQNTDQYSGIVDDLLRAVLQGINKELTLISAKEVLQYLLGSARPSLNILLKQKSNNF
ncbi:hypothetical protein PYW07_014485 [Mythimna separata]|uniref:Uncharacterized protein n=1 Tax=Mythimna separata TaxID=271217 RepID=A0AAD7Z142_MYTSE|nr:hypothetical protein PYW07_014485 [Mythimna separata]